MSRVIGRLSRYWKGRGPAATLLFVISRIFRREVNIVYEATLEKPLSPARWDANEKLLLFGPENIDSSLNPRLVAFLGGGEAFESLLRRFKSGVEREGILGDYKRHQTFMSRGEKARAKLKRAERKRRTRMARRAS